MKRWLLLVVLILCPLQTQGQTLLAQFDKIMISGRGFPEAGSTITVCTSAGTLIPSRVTLQPGCSPQVTIYRDPYGAAQQSNPFLTDGLGNAVFYAPGGLYTYSITGPTVNPVLKTLVLSGGMAPCSTTALGGLDIIPQTCAGEKTLQGLTPYASQVNFTVTPPSTGQRNQNVYLGEPYTLFDNSVGDGSTGGAWTYLNTLSGSAITSSSIANLDPSGDKKSWDGLVTYLQQKDTPTNPGGMTAIKGINEVLKGAFTFGGVGGVAGKVIYGGGTNGMTGLGGVARMNGLGGEVWDNGDGTSQIGYAVAVNASVNWEGFGSVPDIVDSAGLSIDVRGFGGSQAQKNSFAWNLLPDELHLHGNVGTSFLDVNDNLVIGYGSNANLYTPLTTIPFTPIAGSGNAYFSGKLRQISGVGGGSGVAGTTTGDAGGIKHIRLSTGSVAGTSRADVTVTWAVAFPDVNYTPVCSVLDTSGAGLGLVFERIRVQLALSMTVQVFNQSAGALTGTLNCFAFHD
jgi:hypothetical protein